MLTSRLAERFAGEIFHDVIAFQPRRSFQGPTWCTWEYRTRVVKLLSKYGTEILAARLHSPHGLQGSLLTWTTSTVKQVLRLDDGASGLTKEQCTVDICKALVAVGQLHNYLIDDHGVSLCDYEQSLPAAAAAAGSFSALNKLRPEAAFNKLQLLPLRNAISAAAASGQDKMLKELLSGNCSTVGPPNRILSSAMCAAAYHDNVECAETIFNSKPSIWTQSTQTSYYYRRMLIDVCIARDSRKVFDLVLKWSSVCNVPVKLETYQQQRLLSTAEPALLQHLDQNDLVDSSFVMLNRLSKLTLSSSISTRDDGRGPEVDCRNAIAGPLDKTVKT